MLGLWVLANAAAAQQIVSRALFHQLSIDLAEDRRCEWELVGAIAGRRVELLEGVDVAGKRPLAARVPGPGAAFSAKRSPRATPPGTQPSPKKRRKKR